MFSKIKLLILISTVFAISSLIVLPEPQVSAAEFTCNYGTTVTAPSAAEANRICSKRAPDDCKVQPLDGSNCRIVGYLLNFIKVLSAIVGIVVAIMIAVGGLQYAASRDNPQATVNAKNRLKTAVLALVGYLFIYAFLQYVIPGGLL